MHLCLLILINKINQYSNTFLLIYLSSTLAPAASNLALISSASFLFTPDFTSLGAPSTKSFASLRPSDVAALTSLITLIFLSPAETSMIVNSSFSSAAAAPPAAAGAAAAIGVTPYFSSNCFESSAASATVKLDKSSIILFRSGICFTLLVVFQNFLGTNYSFFPNVQVKYLLIFLQKHLIFPLYLLLLHLMLVN